MQTQNTDEDSILELHDQAYLEEDHQMKFVPYDF